MARKKKRNGRVAFDMGGVMTSDDLENRKRPEGGYRLVNPRRHCIPMVRKFVQRFTPDNLFIISRARDGGVQANWKLLDAWRFWQTTGFKRANVIIYDGERSKKAEWVKRHEITDMVDDRVEILTHMPVGVKLIAFSPKSEERRQFEPLLNTPRRMALGAQTK